MLILEYKVKAKPQQFAAIDEAIRTGQLVQNKALRLWIDVKGTSKYDLSKLCKQLAKEFPFANELNSMARQAHADRAWASISRFYDNCKKGINLVGYPTFKKFARSVEYKTSGWKLLNTNRTHACKCGCKLERDENAAINILNKGLATVGHTGSTLLDKENAL
ncbi:hypothetical protein IQ260_25340 [Leptolyngbya cf. ectocarpi LEGE 11479]|uniref:Transposase n=1 Tax=Leptolyngbya cf. ectocarpi LEGE 11479 TaxID=1828722 RepID=A0A928ZYW0_LEPEC|nr:hypothetical protein [Leptolyngbya ectocarpi]MBE9069970.1 hypothetical protein [Leptolyngbya cf. ectocarpi LEGE 11479]